MHNARLYRGMAGLILVSIPLGALLQQTPHQVRMEQDPLARTRKHIVDCVEPLCREVLPHEDKLLFLAAPVPSPSIRRQRKTLWSVECLDAAGETRMRLLWNAEANSLISLYQVNLRDPALSHPVISKTQAVHEARVWLETLALVPPGDTQQGACTVETERSAYDINFRLKGQRVTVCINACSDELLFVLVDRGTPVP